MPLSIIMLLVILNVPGQKETTIDKLSVQVTLVLAGLLVNLGHFNRLFFCMSMAEISMWVESG